MIRDIQDAFKGLQSFIATAQKKIPAVRKRLSEPASKLAQTGVFGVSTAAIFWLVGHLEPIKHVAFVAGATTPINFGVACAAYFFTGNRLMSATNYQQSGSTGSNTALSTLQYVLIKTAAISAATFVLSGGLSLPAFVATTLLIETISRLESGAALYNLRANVGDAIKRFVGGQGVVA